MVLHPVLALLHPLYYNTAPYQQEYETELMNVNFRLDLPLLKAFSCLGIVLLHPTVTTSSVFFGGGGEWGGHAICRSWNSTQEANGRIQRIACT